MTASSFSKQVRERVRRRAGNRCEYCLAHQDHVFDILEIDHIVPRSAGGSDDEENLCLSCGLCNRYKGSQTHDIDPLTGRVVEFFNPRCQAWHEHLRWREEGLYIEGLTECGRATVKALQMNNDIALVVRRHWVAAGWYPPQGE
jgi:Zn ribbon nucleic-acid-binding protein